MNKTSIMKILRLATKYDVPVFIKENLDWNKIKPRQFPGISDNND
jgi:hypothetical protein